MSERFSYRVLTLREEDPYERKMAELAVKVISSKLNLRGIDLHFIALDAFGEISFDGPVAGFCPHSGREIFITRGQSDRDLVLAVLHELRHCFQRQTGKHCLSKNFMEQDAQIFELEINPPATGPEIRRWLWLEEMFHEEPGLRESFEHVDKIMARRQVPERVPEKPKTQSVEHRRKL